MHTRCMGRVWLQNYGGKVSVHVLWYNYERDHIVHNVIQVCISGKLGRLTTALVLGFSGFNSSVGFLHVPDADSDEGMVIPKLGQLMSVLAGCLSTFTLRRDRSK